MCRAFVDQRLAMGESVGTSGRGSSKVATGTPAYRKLVFMIAEPSRRRRVPRALAMVAVVGTAFALMQSPAPAAPAAGLPECAWPVVTNAEQFNVAYPDTSATYWTAPFQYEPGMTLTVQGEFPQARFFSLNTYDSTFGAFTVNGAPSALVDYQIDPDPGSANPWQDTPDGSQPEQFTVVAQDQIPGTGNVVPIAPTGTPAGSLGYLIMRVYLPEGADFATVPLPQITASSAAGTTTIEPCDGSRQTAPGTTNSSLQGTLQQAMDGAAQAQSQTKDPATGGGGPCRGQECPPRLAFFRASAAATNAVFPNSATAYVSAIMRPRSDRVVVVRGKAPRTPARPAPGTEPVVWPQQRYQLRYFSLCTNLYRRPWPVVLNALPNGATDPGCRADNETTVNARGRYNYVVARERQQQVVERWRSATFVPTANRERRLRELLILRNMLPAPDFARSAASAPQNDSPAAAAKAMRAYYPRAVSCPVDVYRSGGPSACFRR